MTYIKKSKVNELLKVRPPGEKKKKKAMKNWFNEELSLEKYGNIH